MNSPDQRFVNLIVDDDFAAGAEDGVRSVTHHKVWTRVATGRDVALPCHARSLITSHFLQMFCTRHALQQGNLQQSAGLAVHVVLKDHSSRVDAHGKRGRCPLRELATSCTPHTLAMLQEPPTYSRRCSQLTRPHERFQPAPAPGAKQLPG